MRRRTLILLGAMLTAVSCLSSAQNGDRNVLSQAAVAEDVDVFRREFLGVDISYSPRARARAERLLQALGGKNQHVITFALEICRIVALADNGHSECRPPPVPRVTIQFTPLGGSYYVLGAQPANSDLLGAQVVSVDGRSMVKIAEAGFGLRGGVTALREYSVAELLRTPARLHALGLADLGDTALYRFRSRSGTMLMRQLSAGVSLSELTWLTPPQLAPWSQQNQEQPFRWVDRPALDAIVIQLRRNSDAPNQRILDFLLQAEANRVRLGRQNVVLDMHYNSGGNLMSTREFMVGWPDRIPSAGRIYVIQGPRTFSAAISNIGYLKQSGGKRVVLVGAPPGDRMVFFAEGKDVTLPNSGITVVASQQRHDYRNGCRRFDDCFPGVAQPGGPAAIADGEFARMPISLKDLNPDVRVRPTIDDMASGRDAELEAVEALLRRARSSPVD